MFQMMEFLQLQNHVPYVFDKMSLWVLLEKLQKVALEFTFDHSV